MNRLGQLILVFFFLFAGFSLGQEQESRKPSTDELHKRLIKAVVTGDPDAVIQALNDGANIDGRTESGLTPWALAKRTGFDGIAELLESKGARTDLPLPSPSESVERWLASHFDTTTPAAAVLAAKDGRILFQIVKGCADIEKKQLATVDTKFRIGSVTKQFTAAAILKLQEEEKLSIQDRLSKFIADFPRGDEVTLEHLLNHTSGIKSFTSKPEFAAQMTQAISEEKQIESFKNDPFDFDPGTQFSYNNSGYFLLGHIVAKVSGTSYGEYLRRTFFEPLQMVNTGVHSPDLKLNHEAKGYSVIDGEVQPAIDWHMSQAGGAGALYSTLHDLFVWNEAIFGGRILSQASLDAAFRPTTLADGSTVPYGYGWAIGKHRGLPTIQHSGGLDGFLSFLVRYPEQDVTIVVCCNVSPPGDFPTPTQISRNVAELLLWEQMEKRSIRRVDRNIDPKLLDDFVGTYDYGSGMILEVTRDGDQLYAQLTGQPKFPIYPLNSSTFFWKVVDAEVEFVRDESGKVVKAIHRQNGNESENKRIESPPLVNLSEEQLEAFVGTYDYGSGLMRITRKGKQLHAQLAGQPSFPIFPVSKNKFVWRAVKAEVEFVQDEQGKTIKAIHSQQGRKIEAPRVDEVKPLTLPPEKLDEYVGRYNYGLFTGKMQVTRKGNQLFAKLPRQPTLEIVPVGEDTFRWKDVNATIRFERDKDGKVVRGVHTQNGRTFKVPKVD